MFNEISDAFIIKCLSSEEEMLSELNIKIQKAKSELNKTDEDLIYAASIPGTNNFPVMHTQTKDLQDVLNKYDNLFAQQIKQIRFTQIYLTKLYDELETINRIRVCKMFLSVQEKNVLDALYGSESTSTKSVLIDLEKKYGYSKSAVYRLKRSGLNTIRNHYMLNKSNIELLNMVI